MGPSVILDKSALEALSVDESVWLEALLDANVVPVFYVEVLGDLEKQGRQGQPPKAVVGRLAEKTPSNAYPNVHHRQLLVAELAGARIDMTGRPVISGGEVRRAADGKVGFHVDEFPEQTALRRWQRHDFEAVERVVAKQWRDELATQNLDAMVELVKVILPADRKISDLQQLKALIDGFCERGGRTVISLAAAVLGLSDKDTRALRERWEKDLKRSITRLAPYTAHVFKVDLLFYLGIARGFISRDRASNLADMAYLYYLPFAAAFASGDGLHRRTVPLFLSHNQSFIDARALKTALQELNAHYDALPEEVKQLGVLAFASYPPPSLDNAVTRLWDGHMRPDWRDIAAKLDATLGAPRDKESERRTVDEFNAQIDEAELVDDESAAMGPGGPDYVLRRRQVPATKGKWRMVSAQVEAGGHDDQA
jgi:hypothetical protein